MLLLALVVLPLSAQRPTKYRVQRGETLSSIAHKFGMTERELKRLNDDLSYCYAGMVILVKDKRGPADDERYDDYADRSDYADDRIGYADDRIDMDGSTSLGAPMGDPLLAEAHQLEQRGKFKQAVKCYDKVLDRGPSAPLFFQRGVCYFQMKKWKKAIDDFERVTRSSDASRELRARSEDYIDEAYMQWDAKKERSTNTVAGIIAGAVAVGVVADALSGSGSSSSKGDSKRGGKNGQAQGKQGAPPKGSGQQAGQRGGRGDNGQQTSQRGGNGRNRSEAGQRGGNGGSRDGQGVRQGGNGQRGSRDASRGGGERRRNRQ